MKPFVLTYGEHDDYSILMVLMGPADADSMKLKAAFEDAKGVRQRGVFDHEWLEAFAAWLVAEHGFAQIEWEEIGPEEAPSKAWRDANS